MHPCERKKFSFPILTLYHVCVCVVVARFVLFHDWCFICSQHHQCDFCFLLPLVLYNTSNPSAAPRATLASAAFENRPNPSYRSLKFVVGLCAQNGHAQLYERGKVESDNLPRCIASYPDETTVLLGHKK